MNVLRATLNRYWIVCFLLTALLHTQAEGKPFVAVDANRDSQPTIVVQFDATTGSGFDWEAMNHPRVVVGSPKARLRDAVQFLQEGVQKMTGVKLVVQSQNDLQRGIILLLRRYAPADLSKDPALTRALADDGSDPYNHREAFYLRSEPERLLIVANTVDGLVAAVPRLLETVDYEILGMGPNWIHVPQNRKKLIFDVDLADRPSFYLRQLSATTGQSYGVGTIKTGPKLSLSDPADESVSTSYARWSIGIRNLGHSMASFPGHAMYQYHRRTVEEMLRTGTTDGFLTPQNHLGKDSERPAASEANTHHLWINTDPKGEPGHLRAFVSNGKEWKEQKLLGMNVNVDLSTPFVRQIVLEEMKQRANRHFAEEPEEMFVFGTEAEDGAGYHHVKDWMRPQNRDWYPQYLREQKAPWPAKYVLHQYRGIDQPVEKWDYAFPADIVFGFNNWLLREFDRWIDSLPAAEQVTSAGVPKKSLVRCSCYSYAYHDVSPHINLDPRIRVMIAGYPKHRGLEEWKQFATQHDVAAAFKVMLPREPSGEYRIPSIAYYADDSLEGIPARWSAAPERILEDLQRTFHGGIRAMTYETDFNFGKYGLAYYLMSKVLWNSKLSATELTAIRDRWFQRSYGNGWREMRAYYDFMLVDNFSANAPGTWAKAIRLIDAADAKIDPAQEPDCQRRLDDLKQYWYFYYLVDTNRFRADSPELLEFLWKGQMSYMTAMHMVLHRACGPMSRLDTSVPEELRRGPAHYSSEETARWWQQLKDHWPEIEVNYFADARLANGRQGKEVDLHDLVRVAPFQAAEVNPKGSGKPLIYNSAQAANYPFLTMAQRGEAVGFKFSWPANDEQLRFYGPKDVPYGIEFWNPQDKTWTSLIDVTLTTAASQRLEKTPDGKARHLVEVRFPAPQTGTYRIEIGRGGFSALLSSLGYDPTQGEFTERLPQTYFSRLVGLTQDPVYIYLPKGTKSLDLENWSRTDRKQVQLYRGINDKGLVKSRVVDIGKRGTHRVPLEEGEDGMLAAISGNGFAFPLLYSVPSLWAKCPAELLVPRAIAEADGLKIVAE